MNARRTTTAAAVALGAAALSAVAGPAMAESRTTDDAQHDVVRLDDDSRPGAGTPTRRSDGDVTSMTATYDGDAVSVQLRYAALRPARNARSQTVHLVSLRTDAGRRIGIGLITGQDHPRGQRYFERDDEPVRCDGLRARVDDAAAEADFTVPRSCLGNPAWVRVGGGAGVLQGNALFADDVARDGAVGDELTLGPRIHRN